MSDTKFLIHLMSHLPPEYDDTCSLLELKLLSTKEPLDLPQFRQLVFTKYDRLKQCGEIKSAGMALSTEIGERKKSKKKKKIKTKKIIVTLASRNVCTVGNAATWKLHAGRRMTVLSQPVVSVMSEDIMRADVTKSGRPRRRNSPPRRSPRA